MKRNESGYVIKRKILLEQPIYNVRYNVIVITIYFIVSPSNFLLLEF